MAPADNLPTDDTSAVRPYAMTGGRTRASGDVLPIEALVSTIGRPPGRLSAEQRRILDLATGQYLAIAELSAHIHLPVGVVRVLVGDLSDAGLVRVHAPVAGTATSDPATTLSVLESVLDGISAL